MMMKINSWDDENLDLKNNLLRGIYSYGFEISKFYSKIFTPAIYGEKGAPKRYYSSSSIWYENRYIYCWMLTNDR